MAKDDQERKASEILDFRYSIIAELLNPYLTREERRKLIRQKAKREYDIPYFRKTRITEACIKKWYTKFKEHGKGGLIPKPPLNTMPLLLSLQLILLFRKSSSILRKPVPSTLELP